jgi:Heparinase II/III-like protein/Heparinase II/III N-terminus
MSPGEVAWRIREQALRRAWARRQVRPGDLPSGQVPGLIAGERRFAAVLPDGVASAVPESARAALLADADRILKGEWDMLGVVRTDMEAPDWFYDPVTGRRSDPGRYAFAINQRSEEQVGNVKQVWEVNRLQHLTLLAAAWYLTGEDVYAERVDKQLRDWWQANPFLSGVNWTSGIELGIRLINFAWIRRLLDSWPGAGDLFEGSDLALRQVRWHQEYLAAFVSRGSSANNHVIAEAAGQLAASCAFPWFPESERWRRASADLLAGSLAANTFPSGINRELATDYHGFVFELGVYAALEASAAGYPVDDDTWRLLCSMADCMAALVDSAGRPPRQGDSDEGRVVLLDAPAHNRWPELLSVGAALFGSLDWWPGTEPGAASTLAGALAGTCREVPARPARPPSRFPDAGITLLRTKPGESPEIWCRCDGGPHGFGSLAAHAHADALSAEVRYGGVDILADPGTYCYHGEPEWRSYFRSTIGHNTAEIGGRSQSAEGGPFMWQRHARTEELDASDVKWTAAHDGYKALHSAASHRRTVRLYEASRTVEITDAIDAAGHELRMAFHFGPDIEVELNGAQAILIRSSAVIGRLDLPGQLSWERHRGETGPVLGWYSPHLGMKVPAYMLLGSGRGSPKTVFISRLIFTDGVER